MRKWDKGYRDQKLYESVVKGKWRMASYWHSCGARHSQLWALMAHSKNVIYMESVDMLHKYPDFATVFFYHRKTSTIVLRHIVLTRQAKARQAAIAVLSLKNKGHLGHFLNKDVCTMIAKMIYQDYENRYSDKWGEPSFSVLSTAGEILFIPSKMMLPYLMPIVEILLALAIIDIVLTLIFH